MTSSGSDTETRVDWWREWCPFCKKKRRGCLQCDTSDVRQALALYRSTEAFRQARGRVE